MLIAKGPSRYPSNSLRSASLRLSRTRHALIADVDLLPSFGLYESLSSRLSDVFCEGISARKPRPIFLVLPTFELSAEKVEAELSVLLNEHSSDARQRLKALWHSKCASAFHASSFPAGHGSTDYQQWFQSPDQLSYDISWTEGYEPYGVLECASAPAFDARFDSFFPLHDKHSFFVELFCAGWEFSVFCEGFLIDRHHAP